MKNELSQYSKEMSALILGEFPSWKEYAGIDEYNGEVYFNVAVPSPSSKIESQLRVYTYQDEITVSFDAYHAHFFEFKEEDDEIAVNFSGTTSEKGGGSALFEIQNPKWLGTH